MFVTKNIAKSPTLSDPLVHVPFLIRNQLNKSNDLVHLFPKSFSSTNTILWQIFLTEKRNLCEGYCWLVNSDNLMQIFL